VRFCPLGIGCGLSRRSTSAHDTPRWLSSMASATPTGPPPTMITSYSSTATLHSPPAALPPVVVALTNTARLRTIVACVASHQDDVGRREIGARQEVLAHQARLDGDPYGL
jgi:hypothetical protein